MAVINKEKRDKILEQSLSEIEFDRKYKERRIETSWHKNEKIYYGEKPNQESSRSNVMLPKAQGFVDTILAKVDKAPKITFKRVEEADLKKERRLNALIELDAFTGNWVMKDILGKRQALLYGRCIYEYHADSVGGYKSHLTNVDAYDFLIDPSAGGLDIELADHLGRTGIVKSEHQLKSGKNYIKSEVNALIESYSKPDDTDERNKENRYYALKTDKNRLHTQGKKMYTMTEWYTTYEGERYYLLINEKSGKCIRIEKLTTLFKTGKYPFITWATQPDLIEFWTPSPLDAVREIFMAQTVTINQMLDNAEQINKPMKAYNINAIDNPILLKFRKDGLIPIKSGYKPSDIHILETPSIQTPLEVYDKLEQIANIESGITADAKGMSEEDRVGILNSNIAQVADRIGLLNKSYSDAYRRLGELYYDGVCEHLNKKIAVKMIGTKGVQFEEIKKEDVKAKKSYDVTVISSDSEEQLDIQKKKDVVDFLATLAQNPMVNQKAVVRIGADIIGLSNEQVNELLSKDDSEAELMSDAARDIQMILEEKMPEPNHAANVAYMQKLVDYLRNEGENLTETQEMMLTQYIEAIRPTVVRNSLVNLSEQIAQEAAMAQGTEVLPGQQTGQERIVREQNA